MHQIRGTKVPPPSFLNHIMMALGRTWIVVLDDSRARFFVRDLSGRLVEASPALQRSLHDPASSGPDGRRNARDKYFHEIVNTIDAACDRGACDQIMLVGPERLLSVMRKRASDKMRARLWREMAAELTGRSETDLAKRLGPHFK